MGFSVSICHGLRLWVLRDFVGYVGDAPDATDQELREAPDEIVGNRHFLQAEIGELSLVETALVVQLDRQLVDDLVAALSP